MKQLVNVLYREILNKLSIKQSNIVRIEGIDNPVIYHQICLLLGKCIKIDELIPKLTREKYVQFINMQNSDWKQSLEYLSKGYNEIFDPSIYDVSDEYAKKSFVDFNNAITKWRNESSNYGNDRTTLVLLMGTEEAQDTGGLADTSFVLSPKEIINSLSKDYSSWFKKIIELNDIHEDYKTSIHTLYKALFSQISTDIFRLSDYIDSLTEFEFSSVQELIEHICETLNVTWGVPSIIDKKAVPQVSSLNKGTLTSSKIILNAVKFIERVNDIPTVKELDKLDQKFNKYLEVHDINSEDPFPQNQAVFINFEEFKKTVMDFMQGIDIDLNRRKLLQVDFSIINEIIDTKLKKDPPPKATTYSGNPIEVYSRIFFDVFNNFKKNINDFPSKISIRVDRVALSDCTDDQKKESYTNICNFVGGILNFYNELPIEIGEQILEFEYDDEYGDPFDLSNYENISSIIKSTGKWGEPCKIHFSVNASNGEKSRKYEYKWVFSPYAPWLNAFDYLDNVFYSSGATYVLPTMVVCSNMQDYLECESEDEFYAYLQQFRGYALYDEHKAIIREYFDEIINSLYDLVCESFKEFASKTTKCGYFNSCKELRKLVDAYTKLIEGIHVHYDSFTDVQKEKIGLLINIFTISSKENVLDIDDMGEVIVPAYNPIVLEKIDAQQLFLRRGFKEVIEKSISEDGIDSILLSRFNKLVQLSSITQAADVVRRKTNEYLMCRKMWEYYGIYYENNIENELLSGNTVDFSIVTDDEDASAMLKNSPMSNIIVRNVMDYVRTFPARIDGINIAFVAPTDIQHIVSAIHSIAKNLENEECPATINIKIISINSKKNSASYLRRWLDSYFSDERTVKVNTFLHNCTIYTKTDVEYLRELLSNYDLCFTYNILQSAGVQFDLSIDETIDMNYEKYPMTFTPDTLPASHGKGRRINISQFQFLAAKEHTQTGYIIGNPHSVKGTYRVYRLLELPEIQNAIVEISHSCCKWVVCIDQAIDRNILESSNSKIIGFTTGEGTYGELNVTVSARKDILIDIKKMLRRRITEKFSNWDKERLTKATNFCVDELSQYMDGSRILKALNPYDYEIHSFLAYILTLQILGLTKKNNDYIVRSLISLDSYKHWFEDDELSKDNKRPDFMLIEIPYEPDNITKGTKLKINVKIIECKMGFQNDDQVDKAKTQLEKGLYSMAMNWRAEANGSLHRYWLNQLYRAIIFSPLNIEIASEEYNIVREKIYGILNGNFEIEWSGDIFAFWLDVNDETPDEYEIHSSISRILNENDIMIGNLVCHNYGQMYIQKMLLPEEERNMSFTYNQIDNIEDEDSDEDDEIQDDYEDDINIDELIQGNGETIPQAKDIYIPFIELLSDSTEHTRQECLNWFKNYFSISENDQKVAFDSNGHLKYETALDFVITDFRRNNLIENSEKGKFHITELGQRVLERIKNSNEEIDFMNIVKSFASIKMDDDISKKETKENQFTIQKIGITNMQVDCIVNAANNQLNAGGGVCGAIFKEAGYYELQKACDKIGYCDTGKAVITPAFQLPSKYIIHAVGPIWNGGDSNESEQLYSAYTNSLKLAIEYNCYSIAFPLISSGIFGYPKEQAWNIAITAIYDFFNEHKDIGIHVFMSVIDEEMYRLGMDCLNNYLDKLKEILPEIPEKEDEYAEEDNIDKDDDLNDLESIRVLIGKDKKNIPIYWEYGNKKLANRHILITGTSGQGKTYAIQTMILELARQKISSVVFDYTDGFLPGKLEPEFESELEGKIAQEVAILNKIPVNPFRLQMIDIPPFGSVPEKSTTVAGRLSDILKHVYSFGDQQAACIYAACKQGVDDYGQGMDFAKLRIILEEMDTSQSKSVLSKMAQFFDMDLFDSTREFNWKDVTQSEGKVTIIQLTGLDRELQTIITEIMMWDAWYSLTKFGNKNTPFVVVLDEAQNLSFKEKSPAEKILREGRKYGWSAWFATQFLKGALDSGEISNLQQASERLYFKPTGEEMNYIADQISDNKAETAEWYNIIKGIQKGQCIVQGDRIKANGVFGAAKPVLVNVSSFNER